jgi:vesicle-associated membrane protein 7
MWWKNKRVLGLGVLVALVIFWLIMAQFCGVALRCGAK